MILIYRCKKIYVFGESHDSSHDSNFVKHMLNVYYKYPKLWAINDSLWLVPGTLDEYE